MQSPVQQLVNLLYQAIPTGCLFLFLVLYLRQVYFKPLGRVLEERRRATEGVREFAAAALHEADQKSSEFERALQAARAEIYREQEALRARLLAQQADTLGAARTRAEERLEQTRLEASAAVERATQELLPVAEQLADRMIDSLLRRRVAA